MLPVTKTLESKTGLAHWSARVLEECEKAGQEFAPDPVHDLRVAIRRCRSMADGFLTVDPDRAWRQMKRLGKVLFASLGDLRDTQVMIEWVTRLAQEDDPVRGVLLHTLQIRESEQKVLAQQALHSFDREQWQSLNAHLAPRTNVIPLDGLVFQHLALERWLDAHVLHHQALRNRSQVGYHQLRIGIKRFRYTVENFLPKLHDMWSRDLRDLQDALGEVHDFDVLWTMIREHTEVAANLRQLWREKVAVERQKRLDFYRSKMLGKNSLWRRWRSELPSGEELQRAGLEKLKTWASFLDPDFEHSRLVARFALQLYDGLAQLGVLVASHADRRILETAALLHEVGRSQREKGHQKRTYRVIRKQNVPLGWSAAELHAAAIVARYHRGALAPSSNAVFAGISARRRSELLRLAGILRLANAFDLTHERQIEVLSVTLNENTVVISGAAFNPISPVAERLARARYLLEATCKVAISVRPTPIAPARAATNSIVARQRRSRSIRLDVEG